MANRYQAARATAEALASEEELKIKSSLLSSEEKGLTGKTQGRIRRLLDMEDIIPPVLDVEADEPHIAAGREILRNARSWLNSKI